MSKITKQEFENWRKTIEKKILDFANSPFARDNLSEEELAAFSSLAGDLNFGLKNKNPFALIFFVIFYENLPGHDSIKNQVFADTNDLTLQQWLDSFKQRLKEHAEADGYYKSSEPIDKSALRQSWKRVWELVKDSDSYTKLRLHLKKESISLINTTKIFFEAIARDLEVKDNISDIKESSNILKNFPFLMKDLAGRVEEAEKKLEQAERERERETTPTILLQPPTLADLLMII